MFIQVNVTIVHVTVHTQVRQVFANIGVSMSPEVFEQLWKEAERRDPKGQVCVGVFGRTRVDSFFPLTTTLSGERGVFPCAYGGGASTSAITRPTSSGRTHGLLQLAQRQGKWRGFAHNTLQPSF